MLVLKGPLEHITMCSLPMCVPAYLVFFAHNQVFIVNISIPLDMRPVGRSQRILALVDFHSSRGISPRQIQHVGCSLQVKDPPDFASVERHAGPCPSTQLPPLMPPYCSHLTNTTAATTLYLLTQGHL